jgi:hypothetical protein
MSSQLPPISERKGIDQDRKLMTIITSPTPSFQARWASRSFSSTTLTFPTSRKLSKSSKSILSSLLCPITMMLKANIRKRLNLYVQLMPRGSRRGWLQAAGLHRMARGSYANPLECMSYFLVANSLLNIRQTHRPYLLRRQHRERYGSIAANYKFGIHRFL